MDDYGDWKMELGAFVLAIFGLALCVFVVLVIILPVAGLFVELMAG